MQRLKVAQVMQRGSYTPLRVARKLKAMLADSQLAQRAEKRGQATGRRGRRRAPLRCAGGVVPQPPSNPLTC